ncbi:SH3 domain-containing protein [uncultured Roseobacter sp.]|uniref:SH3 domain-containing protein n=1 Tax=uncultured Roseobacter sp. TaxID=114847 RepID=UPI002620E6ED|nr:SH3 domain-containing protein [uncultured Roseobacter sp.]
MDRYRVTSDWKAAYPDPIVLSAGEELWLTGKSDTWDGYVWVWARNQRGKEGWIPDTLVQSRAVKTYANADFSAVELTCHRGEELLALGETHGWILCRAQNGAEGWVPARNLSAI